VFCEQSWRGICWASATKAEKMHSPLNSPQLWVPLEFLLTEPIRCPVQLGRWLEFLLQQLTVLMS
jgi:hypothetical protein